MSNNTPITKRSAVNGSKMAATGAAINRFRIVEQLRLQLEQAEHQLMLALRPDIYTERYAERTAAISRRNEEIREQLIKNGKLPDKIEIPK